MNTRSSLPKFWSSEPGPSRSRTVLILQGRFIAEVGKKAGKQGLCQVYLVQHRVAAHLRLHAGKFDADTRIVRAVFPIFQKAAEFVAQGSKQATVFLAGIAIEVKAAYARIGIGPIGEFKLVALLEAVAGKSVKIR